MMTNGPLTIRPLLPEDAPQLSAMLRTQPADYSRFFYPFSFDEAAIAGRLSACVRDVYMGVYHQADLVGLFMLRGWDEGYEVPAFGILIDGRYRGYGLEMMSLETAKIICKLRGAPRMMLKMHPDNFSSRGVARKIGFRPTGVEPKSGNIIYHCEIEQRERKRHPNAAPDN